MAFVLEFDARNNILRARLEGRMTDDVMLDCYAAMAKCEAAHPACRAIADVSAVTEFSVSSTAIRQLAQTPPAVPEPYMRVFVAPQLHIFGMARMFQMLGEETRPNLHIVRSMDEAYRLLQAETPDFIPVR